MARIFANSTTALSGVQMGVLLTMYDVNETLGLPESSVMVINMNLTQALKIVLKRKKSDARKKVALNISRTDLPFLKTLKI